MSSQFSISMAEWRLKNDDPVREKQMKEMTKTWLVQCQLQNLQPKREKVPYLQYQRDALKQALSAVRQNRLSVTAAAKKYGVPRKTLDDRVKGKVLSDAALGRPVVLDAQHEIALVDYCMYMAELGFPLNRKRARGLVQEMMTLEGRRERFGNNGPSDKWFRSFFARHPELIERKASRRELSQLAESNQTVMDHWFNLLGETMDKLQLGKSPERIFNCGKTMFLGKEQPRQRVLCGKSKQSYQIQLNTADHVTAQLCVNAAGEVLPSFLVYKGALPHQRYRESVPGSWLFSASDSGCMDSELFFQWFCRIFLPHCGRQRPVLLMLDTQESHLSGRLVLKAREENVHILGLPAHTAHFLQPLDVVIFGVLKAKLCDLAASLRCLHANIISRAKLPMVWHYAVDQVCTRHLVQSAFAKRGIVPLNKHAIGWCQLQPSATALPTTATSTATQHGLSTTADDPAGPSTPLEMPSAGSASPPPTTTTTVKTPDGDITSDTTCDSTATLPHGYHCLHCFRMFKGRHPVPAVLNIPENTQENFIVSATTAVESTLRGAKADVVSQGRLITGDAWLQDIRQRDREQAEEQDHTEREARMAHLKNEIEEVTTAKRRLTKQGGASSKKGKGKPVKAKDNAKCHVCRRVWPVGLVDESEQVHWIDCDSCHKWYHGVCIGCTPEEKDYICKNCATSDCATSDSD